MYVLVAILLLTIIILLYYKVIKPAKFWEDRDVPHTKSYPIFGSLKDFVFKKKHIAEVLIRIYKENPNKRCVGYMQFTTPFLMIRDLALIKKITIKDFDHFQNHLAFENIKSDPLLSKSLISLSGENWKKMRATVSPVFTSNKLKIMYELMSQCAVNFVDHFQKQEHVKIEMRDVFSKFSSDVIATTAFGIGINSLENPENEFFKLGSKFTNYSFWSILKIFLMQMVPKISSLLQLQVFPDEVGLFFRNLIKENIKTREENHIVRPDLIHLLMEARKGNLRKENFEYHDNFAAVEEFEIIGDSVTDLSDDHIAAQALTFFFAGFDTVSTVACFLAYELAVHPEVQEKLHHEIDEVNKKYDGAVPYDVLLSMKYLDQVLCESLRLWPSAFQTDRLCVKDYVIEPKNPKEKVVFIPKGTSVMVPIIAIHRDSQYYPNPNKFDPERFNDENKSKIVPGSYLPFGSGPRNCIGSRFAILEIKILFFHLLAKFNLIPTEYTPIPMKLSPKKINLAPENGFNLCLRLRVCK